MRTFEKRSGQKRALAGERETDNQNRISFFQSALYVYMRAFKTLLSYVLVYYLCVRRFYAASYAATLSLARAL